MIDKFKPNLAENYIWNHLLLQMVHVCLFVCFALFYFILILICFACFFFYLLVSIYLLLLCFVLFIYFLLLYFVGEGRVAVTEVHIISGISLQICP